MLILNNNNDDYDDDDDIERNMLVDGKWKRNLYSNLPLNYSFMACTSTETRDGLEVCPFSYLVKEQQFDIQQMPSSSSANTIPYSILTMLAVDY